MTMKQFELDSLRFFEIELRTEEDKLQIGDIDDVDNVDATCDYIKVLKKRIADKKASIISRYGSL